MECCQKNDKQLIVSSDLSLPYYPAATFSCLVYEDKKCLEFQLLLMEDWKSCDSWLGFFHKYSSSLPDRKWSSTTLVLGGLSGYTVKHQLDIGHEPWELECVFLILIKSHQESSKVPFPTQHANMIKCFYIFVQIIATSAGVTRRPLNWGWGITVLCPHIYIYFFFVYDIVTVYRFFMDFFPRCS